MIQNDKVLLLWDVDGTLIRSKNSNSHAEFLKAYGCESVERPSLQSGMTDYELLISMLSEEARARVGDNLLLKDFDIFYKGLMELQIDRIISDSDLASIGEGVIHGILTGNTLERAKRKLSKADISTFDNSSFIYTCLPGESRESIVKRAKAELDKLGLSCVVIGDTPRDVSAAVSNGMRVISISSGDYSFKELSKFNPDGTIPHFDSSELRKLIFI